MDFLETIFGEFCEFFDGELRWSRQEMRTKVWTDRFVAFLEKQKEKEALENDVKYKDESTEYMALDYVWRRADGTRHIDLAAEHENVGSDIQDVLDHEIQHLVDIKASNKIGVFYPYEHDEKSFIKEVGERISAQRMRSPDERYLVILGYRRPPVEILFRGFFFDSKGDHTDPLDHRINERPKQAGI